MKKWSKPELLNLMLQETKTEVSTDSTQTSGNQESKGIDVFHKCAATKNPFCITRVGSKHTCMAGHNDKLQYKKDNFGFITYDNLISCCS